jgi:hypothetical protein
MSVLRGLSGYFWNGHRLINSPTCQTVMKLWGHFAGDLQASGRMWEE